MGNIIVAIMKVSNSSLVGSERKLQQGIEIK